MKKSIAINLRNRLASLSMEFMSYGLIREGSLSSDLREEVQKELRTVVAKLDKILIKPVKNDV